jgi:hypothetical protein
VLRLARMMADGKASAKRAVWPPRSSMIAGKGTPWRHVAFVLTATGRGRRSPKAGLCQPEYLQAVRRWRRLLEWSELGRPPARVVNTHIRIAILASSRKHLHCYTSLAHREDVNAHIHA